MAIIARDTERGIQQTSKGWVAIEREIGHDDSASAVPATETRRTLLAGPTKKGEAIRVAGTNRVIA